MKQATLFSLVASGLALMAGAAGRPELVAKVASGELKEARASWWGFDRADSTSYLQQAIASGVPRLVIDKMPSPWVVTPLRGVSNQTLVFEPGAEIRAKRGEYRPKGACLLTFDAKKNVTLEGPGTLRMWHADYMTPAYEKSEWRHALSFLSCSNVVVRGLHIVDSGGDGIYLGVHGAPFRNVDVVIRDVVCRDNHRQGISVISAENLLIEGTQLLTTHGTAPQAGIDFEPNHSNEVLKNCVMRNCRAEGNAGHGFEIWAGQLTAASEPVDFRFENCVSVGDAHSFFYGGSGRKGGEVGGRIAIVNCRFENPKRGPAVRFRENRVTPFFVKIENSCVVTRNAAGEAVTTPLDAAWQRKHLPVLTDPDGFLPHTSTFDFTRAKVRDAAPGVLQKHAAFRLRHGGTYIVWADRARTLTFLGRQTLVGRNALSQRPILVKDMNGKTLAKIPLPDTDKSKFTFAAPAAGFYGLEFDVGGNAFLLDGADCPVAVSALEGDVHFVYSAGDFWFVVPEGTPHFAFFPTGLGGEHAGVSLFDPSGKCVWTQADLNCTERVKIKTPAAGLWRVRIARPKTGCFEDSHYGLAGIPGFFFLSPSRTW